MSTYEQVASDELGFGEICEAPFLHDVYVRADARVLMRDEASEKYSRNRWGVDYAAPIFAAVSPTAKEGYVLAHGWHRQAVCLSDDCLVKSALGRDGNEPDGRLLFAPVVDIVPAVGATEEEQLEQLERHYGRFPLRGDMVYGKHAVVELRRCFMVDARDVKASLEGEIVDVRGTRLPLEKPFIARSLTDTMKRDLASRWSAYALRRGQFVVEDNLEKFGELLLDQGISQQDIEQLILELGIVATVGSAYEGGSLERAGAAQEEGDPAVDVLDDIEARLLRLKETTEIALSGLKDFRHQHSL